MPIATSGTLSLNWITIIQRENEIILSASDLRGINSHMLFPNQIPHSSFQFNNFVTSEIKVPQPKSTDIKFGAIDAKFNNTFKIEKEAKKLGYFMRIKNKLYKPKKLGTIEEYGVSKDQGTVVPSNKIHKTLRGAVDGGIIYVDHERARATAAFRQGMMDATQFQDTVRHATTKAMKSVDHFVSANIFELLEDFAPPDSIKEENPYATASQLEKIKEDYAKQKLNEQIERCESALKKGQFVGALAPNLRQDLAAPVAAASIQTQTGCNEISTDTSDLEAAVDYTMKLQANTQQFAQFDIDQFASSLKASVREHKAHLGLTYYLKCKYAFEPRNPALLTRMRSDARVWMTSAKYLMESEAEYKMITTSVLAAFMIDPSEFKIYQVLAQREFWNAATVYNSALTGKVSAQAKGWLFNPSDSWRGHKRSFLFDKQLNLDYSAPKQTSAI